MAQRPQVLIEKWFPIDTIGAESLRDASAAQKPPLNRLHVWWARRPLTTSRASILASVLPAWQPDWPAHLKRTFPTENTYHQWFLRLCGIFGDPVAGRKLVLWARDKGVKLDSPPYPHKRAFTVNPAREYLDQLSLLLEHAWGTPVLSVLDPFAGGGSIPFEALRYGFTTFANELNPVASVILKATLDYPSRFGLELGKDIARYGALLTEKVKNRLEPFFPITPGDSIHAYIWARTITCPYTGKPIPLSPNWWLRKGAKPVAVLPVFDDAADKASFRIVTGAEQCRKANPDLGTVKRGNAVSPWAQNQPVDGDYIKAEAQAGRMGQQLYALAVKRPGGLTFVVPSKEDEAAIAAAEAELAKRLPEWETRGLVPSDAIPDGNKTSEPLRYGMRMWSDLFSPRQLLAMCTLLECYLDIRDQVFKELDNERARAVATYLALATDKGVDWNSILCTWHPGRQVVGHTFQRHDFAFIWSPTEFDASRNLVPWVLDQVVNAYSGIAKLAQRDEQGLLDQSGRAPVDIHRGSAANLAHCADQSMHHINVDPPYYDNVMYAECSDFFYVWMKRSLGDVYPEFFTDELTNKDDETVANVARFADMGRKKKDLAKADYERKMTAAFREMHRVLKDDGVLTVMFTHKKVEAWDTLATSLVGAGFTIQSSWPVHTESEHSLHQAKKNAAASTILLTCRKQESSGEPVWWDDIKGQIRRVAREKAAAFERQGIAGVDLYISTFGPVLSILSENWPVLTSEVDERTGEPKTLRPEVALDLAREEVIALRKQGLLLGRAVQFDQYTDWYLMAWDAFKAEEFPGDEARKLAIALGLDLEKDIIATKRLLRKKSSFVVLHPPKGRRKKDMVDEDKVTFDCWIDAVHTAMMLYEEDGSKACEQFLKTTGLMTDGTFRACIQALLNAIPRTKLKEKFARPEADTLDKMRLAFFDDLTVPAEEEEIPAPVQTEFGMDKLEKGGAKDEDKRKDKGGK